MRAVAIFTACLLAGVGGLLAAPGNIGGDAAPAGGGVVPPARPSIEMSTLSAYGTVDLKTNVVRHSITLQGRINVPDDPTIIGVSHQLELEEATGPDGQNILPDARARPRAQRYFNAARSGGGSPVHLSASLQDLPALPARFETIRGFGYVLIARKRYEHKVDPIRPGAPIDLSTGLMVQITSVQRANQELTVEFRYESEQPRPFFVLSTVAPFITAIEVVDNVGAAYRHRGWNLKSHAVERGISKGEGKLTFSIPDGRTAAALRFDVVTHAVEQPVSFELKDVPVPLNQGGAGE